MTRKDWLYIIIGNMIFAFGLVNVHVPSKITEGGMIGLTILLFRLFSLSPAITSVVLNGGLYLLGAKVMDKRFLLHSIISTILFSLCYEIFDLIGPVLPLFSPWVASVLGAIFVGVGCGLVVTRGVASSGDDCYALIMNKKTRLSISKAYFLSDFIVIVLSYLVYLTTVQMLSSFLTTFISSSIIGWLERNTN